MTSRHTCRPAPAALVTQPEGRLCDAVHVIVHTTSLGGVESTIERRGKLAGQEHVPRDSCA